MITEKPLSSSLITKNSMFSLNCMSPDSFFYTVGVIFINWQLHRRQFKGRDCSFIKRGDPSEQFFVKFNIPMVLEPKLICNFLFHKDVTMCIKFLNFLFHKLFNSQLTL